MDDYPDPTEPSEFDRFEAPRINDPFLQRVIRMHRARARWYRLVSGLCFGLTVLFVVAGIYFFLRGDPQKELRAAEEVELLKEMLELDRKLSDLSREGATLKEKMSRLQRASVLANLLGRLRATIVQLIGETTWENIDGFTRVVSVNLNIVKLLNAQPASGQPAAVIDVESWYPNDSGQFSSASIGELRDSFRGRALSVDDVERKLTQLNEVLLALAARRNPGDTGLIEKDILVDVSAKASALSGELPKIDEIKEEISAALRDVELQVQRAGESAAADEERRQQLQQERQQVKEQLDEFRIQREKIVFMAWLPDLTIRIGTVVLLLFLTQVFLATYRYTLGVSGFYLARSDAIQMLQANSDWSTRFDAADLKLLADALSPEGHRVDPVRDPSESLTELVKAWLGKRP